MKGLKLCAGYVAWWGKTAEEDAHLLKILWRAGAVFHARTTEPQTMMHLETDSNLWGVTVNPYNVNLSAGGSSGGEGALIGLMGSCLGIGTDIGGKMPLSANVSTSTKKIWKEASGSQPPTTVSMALNLLLSAFLLLAGHPRPQVRTQFPLLLDP